MMQTDAPSIQGTTVFRPRGFSQARVHRVPLIEATPENTRGYGHFVDTFESAAVQIVTWPQPGWRPVLPGTGNEGGITQGEFVTEWRGDTVQTFNHAVDKGYLTGWSTDPLVAQSSHQTAPRNVVYTFEANYHPDGGQIFFARDNEPFVLLLALPTDDVQPEHFKAFYFHGDKGFHIAPSVWHQPAFPVNEKVVFDDKQGKVHACIACNFVEEFGLYLEVPLRLLSCNGGDHF